MWRSLLTPWRGGARGVLRMASLQPRTFSKVPVLQLLIVHICNRLPKYRRKRSLPAAIHVHMKHRPHQFTGVRYLARRRHFPRSQGLYIIHCEIHATMIHQTLVNVGPFLSKGNLAYTGEETRMLRFTGGCCPNW